MIRCGASKVDKELEGEMSLQTERTSIKGRRFINGGRHASGEKAQTVAVKINPTSRSVEQQRRMTTKNSYTKPHERVLESAVTTDWVY